VEGQNITFGFRSGAEGSWNDSPNLHLIGPAPGRESSLYVSPLRTGKQKHATLEIPSVIVAADPVETGNRSCQLGTPGETLPACLYCPAVFVANAVELFRDSWALPAVAVLTTRGRGRSSLRELVLAHVAVAGVLPASRFQQPSAAGAL